MYENFAEVYDVLMSDAQYQKRCDYVLSLFEKFDRKPSLMLDLCCGTGSFSNLFSKKDISVIGVDTSEEMLSIARAKTDNNDVLYLCQNAAELDLYGTVDGAVCLMDSLNHITDYGDFCKAISKVSLFLEKDRLFIFDVNTCYKSEIILGNNTFVSEHKNLFLSWQNEYDKEENTNSVFLDFFLRREDGLYERKSENIIEKTYFDFEIKSALENAGLQIIAVYDDMKTTPPTEKSQRVFYITRKL